jgi:hypothetical protein
METQILKRKRVKNNKFVNIKTNGVKGKVHKDMQYSKSLRNRTENI